MRVVTHFRRSGFIQMFNTAAQNIYQSKISKSVIKSKNINKSIHLKQLAQKLKCEFYDGNTFLR